MDFREIAVHIPFDVLDVCGMQNAGDCFKEIIDDLLAGHVENHLGASDGAGSVRNGEDPVGMRFVEFADFGDHFRFEPETELHAESVDFLDELGEIAEFFCVDKPVAEGGTVIVALAEPAVVENEHFDAELGSGFGDVVNFVVVEIEVGRFPVVDEDRAFDVFPGAADDMVH